jgi:hypothetical protein
MTSRASIPFGLVVTLVTGALVSATGCPTNVAIDLHHDAGVFHDGGVFVREVDAGGRPDVDGGVSDAGTAACVDDTFEPNDQRSDAKSLASGSATVGELCPDSAGTNQDDWFSVDTHHGCTVTADLTYDPIEGNLSLLVVAPSGSLAGSSSTITSSQHVTALAIEDGAYGARVRSASVKPHSAYTVTLTSTCPEELSCPADDAAEPNDDIAHAHPIGATDSASGIICAGNDDFYVVPTKAGCTYAIDTHFTDTAGDLDLEAQDSTGTVVGSSDGTSDSEHIDVAAPAPAPLFVRVLGFQNATNTYRLSTREVCTGQ